MTEDQLEQETLGWLAESIRCKWHFGTRFNLDYINHLIHSGK